MIPRVEVGDEPDLHPLLQVDGHVLLDQSVDDEERELVIWLGILL